MINGYVRKDRLSEIKLISGGLVMISLEQLESLFKDLTGKSYDVFEIFMPDAIKECSELNIYNRWGQLQYFSSGYDLRWDGRNSSGSESPSGTYFYTLTVESNQFSGTLNLFR